MQYVLYMIIHYVKDSVDESVLKAPCFQSKLPNTSSCLYGSKQKKTYSPLVRPFLWASTRKLRTTSPRAEITMTAHKIKTRKRSVSA